MKTVRYVSQLGLVLGALVATPLVACSGSTASPGDLTADADIQADGGGVGPDGGNALGPDGSMIVVDGGGPKKDGSTSLVDAAMMPPFDAAMPPSPGDGTPMRNACTPTGSLGNGLTTTHGRLDGYLVSIIPVGGGHACNGDSTHVHLQVLMSNSVYDVAVNVDSLFAERDLPLPDAAWSEGWHTNDALDYASLGLHSTDFTQPASMSALAQQIETELANVNHISVFATGYGPSGAHLVHRQSGGRDGAVVLHPLASPAHALLFSFTTSATF